jgi:hypothetical protein
MQETARSGRQGGLSAFLFELLLNHEDGGSMFPRNVRLLPDYTPEDNILHSDRCENLKSNLMISEQTTIIQFQMMIPSHRAR